MRRVCRSPAPLHAGRAGTPGAIADRVVMLRTESLALSQSNTHVPGVGPASAAFDRGFSGGCFCGAIRYRVSVPPRFVYVCHCTDCRRINGSAFHTGIVVPTDAFVIEAGEPALFEATADSGNTIARYHCAKCGTQLYSQTTADLSVVSMKAGSVTSVPEEEIVPTVEIFVTSRVEWSGPLQGTVRYARGVRGQTPLPD